MKIKRIVLGSLFIGLLLLNVKQVSFLKILFLGLALLRGYEYMNYFNFLLDKYSITKIMQIIILIIGIILIVFGIFDIKIRKKKFNFYCVINYKFPLIFIINKIFKLLILIFIGILLIPYYICVGEVLGLIMVTYMYPDTYLTNIESQHTFIMIYTGFIIMAAEFYILCKIYNIWKEISDYFKKGGRLSFLYANVLIIIKLLKNGMNRIKKVFYMIIDTNLKSLDNKVVIFLLLTFTLTYIQDFSIWYIFKSIPEGLSGTNLGISRMLVPAFSAIFLDLFIFKEKIITKKDKIFYFYFILLTVIYSLLALFVVQKKLYNCPLDFTFLIIIGTILITIINFKTDGSDKLKTSNLSFGKFKYYVIFGLLIFGFWIFNGFLNRSLGLGTIPINEKSIFKTLYFLVFSSILSPISRLPIFFGEEYGWRIFLQDKLTKMFGYPRGIFILGFIWGLWHLPIIFMGYNYPGYPIWGSLLMIIYTINMSLILGLAVVISRSVWLAAFLHGLNNGVANFQYTFICTPNNPIHSFGGGIYGILIFSVIILFINKFWRLKLNKKINAPTVDI